MSLRLAAFIMTYERPKEVAVMIQTLFDQTLPPKRILVVDNSSSFSTENLIKEMNNSAVGYHRMGYNSGPAGAAGFGLKQLADEGFDWILWTDDDDYPEKNNFIERLFSATESARATDKIGVIGTVGSDFNFSKGEMRRLTDVELAEDKLLDVRCIAGGMMPIVNSEVVRAGAVPNKDLFFGFEELDFCFKVSHFGFRIVVPAAIMRERRKAKGRWNLKVDRWQRLRNGSVWREYYSVRNMTYLFSHPYFDARILALYFLKFSLKSLLSFSGGLSFGFSSAKYIMLGFMHGISGKLGKTVMPVSKY